MENRKEDMMEHSKLVGAIRGTGAFEDVQVITYDFGTPDIEITVPSKCKFFALIHLNGSTSMHIRWRTAPATMRYPQGSPRARRPAKSRSTQR